MSFIFGFLDLISALIMIIDNLGLVFQFRRNGTCEKKEYIRICLSWTIFLFLCNMFSCDCKGFFGTVFRLVILAAKVFVTFPLIKGSSIIYKFIVEDGNGEKYYNKACELINAQLQKVNKK